MASYPNPSRWDVNVPIHKRDVFRFAQQWLTEGVPFSFRYEPMTFERAREAMGHVLGESPKHISLTGSARLGYSLGENFGIAYGDKSDFDLFVVSEPLFVNLAIDGREFAARVLSGHAVANNKLEATWWQDTAEKMETLITERECIDHWLIPRRERYPTVDRISRSIIMFERSLTVHAKDQRKWKTSVRVFKNWDAAMRKIGGSLVATLKARGFTIENNV